MRIESLTLREIRPRPRVRFDQLRLDLLCAELFWSRANRMEVPAG
jgi:hypothetical protein